ncbi:MAG TPA: SMC-Scp complex subunit ScpB [Firmicutes bacterium]|nr:SMC-Scp complex subunit ScpB [Candidatus Fermentithermobacillaceae bacterium]
MSDREKPVDIPALLEAILFSADEPVPVSRLAEAMGVTEREVLDAAHTLERLYENRGIMVERLAGGLIILTRPEYAEFIERALSRKVTMSLSKGTLETLAIIAYRQPVTRQDIEAARGVNPEASLETLLEKGLIEEAGRKKTLGRPKLYKTTDEFLKKAGLNSIEDLPLLTGEKASNPKLVPDA